MEPNIVAIVAKFGSAGKAARAAKEIGLDLKRQTIESWCEAGTYPAWRRTAVTALKSLAERAAKQKKRKS